MSAPTRRGAAGSRGHWEGDLIIGKNGASAAATLVERTTRFVKIVALPMGKDSDGLADALTGQVSALPALGAPHADPGGQGAWGGRFRPGSALATSTGRVLSSPHCPWEPGSNENTNAPDRGHPAQG